MRTFIIKVSRTKKSSMKLHVKLYCGEVAHRPPLGRRPCHHGSRNIHGTLDSCMSVLPLATTAACFMPWFFEPRLRRSHTVLASIAQSFANMTHFVQLNLQWGEPERCS